MHPGNKPTIITYSGAIIVLICNSFISLDGKQRKKMQEKGNEKIGFIPTEAEQTERARERLLQAGVSEDCLWRASVFEHIFPRLAGGETIVVCSLTDIAGSLIALLRLLSGMARRGLLIESLDEPWLDMQAEPWSRQDWIEGLVGFAQKTVSFRTRQALSKARAGGKKLGRPSGMKKENFRKFETGIVLYRNSRMSVREICDTAHIDPRSFYRYLKMRGIAPLRKNNGRELSADNELHVIDPLRNREK